jgi:hypothetical protein
MRGIQGINLSHLAYGIFLLLVLSSPLLFYVIVKTFSLIPECTGGLDTCASVPDFKKFVTATWAAVFSLAATAGCLGTIMSFFLRSTKSDPINIGVDVHLGTPIYIGVREILILGFFGAIFGLIMLSLFVGGFVQGDLFPSPFGKSWVAIGLRIPDWSKIFIWCFLAGFSERLVPDLLNGLVRRVELRSDGQNTTSQTSPRSVDPAT